MSGISKPVLIVKEIADKYLQKNFQKLSEYFAQQNQLQDFIFLEIVSTKAVTGLKIAHNLGYVPKDLVRTKQTGPGTITLDYPSWDEQFIYINSTGAFRLRCYVGTYWKDQSAVVTATSDLEILALATTPIGSLIDMISKTAPAGYLACAGQVVNIADYPDLFAFWDDQDISFNTGGESANQFRLPSLSRRVTVGSGGTASSTLAADVTSVGGEETHALGGAEVPVHTHTGPSHTHALNFGVGWDGATMFVNLSPNQSIQGVQVGLRGTFGGGSAATRVDSLSGAQNSITYPEGTGSTGLATASADGTAHNNIQPSFVVLKCVKY